MRINKTVIIFTSVFLILISAALVSHAQPPDPPPCDPFDPLCPIDGGVSFLLAAGIGLGAKKIISKKSEK